MNHIIWTMSYGPYHMDHIIWTIQNIKIESIDWSIPALFVNKCNSNWCQVFISLLSLLQIAGKNIRIKVMAPMKIQMIVFYTRFDRRMVLNRLRVLDHIRNHWIPIYAWNEYYQVSIYTLHIRLKFWISNFGHKNMNKKPLYAKIV